MFRGTKKKSSRMKNKVITVKGMLLYAATSLDARLFYITKHTSNPDIDAHTLYKLTKCEAVNAREISNLHVGTPGICGRHGVWMIARECFFREALKESAQSIRIPWVAATYTIRLSI